jgi:hypothetical protein
MDVLLVAAEAVVQQVVNSFLDIADVKLGTQLGMFPTLVQEHLQDIHLVHQMTRCVMEM